MSRQGRVELAVGITAAVYVTYLLYSAMFTGPMLPLRIDLAILSVLMIAAFEVLLFRVRADVLARIADMSTEGEERRQPMHDPPESPNGHVDPEVVDLTQRLVRRVTDSS